MSNTTKERAARLALDTHDALREADKSEPPSDNNGMPFDRETWLRWRTETSEPAYARWKEAMDALDAAMGDSVGRHPYTFRPICEEILGIAAVREP